MDPLLESSSLDVSASDAVASAVSAHSVHSASSVCYEVPKEQLSALCGVNDQNIAIMAELFQRKVHCRGNQISLQSEQPEWQELFRHFVDKVLAYMEQGIEARPDLLDALFQDAKSELQNMQGAEDIFFRPGNANEAIHINGKKVMARNRNQAKLLQMFAKNDVIFALGPAGTGKTFLAVAYALEQLMSGQIELLLLSRPVVEAGESLGFLPGDFGQKISPYMLPLFDAIRYLLKAEQVAAFEAKGMIEVAPLAYMRGRSLHNAIVILDEAQNSSPEQVKMLLTRLGEGSKAILTGDPSQSDLAADSVKTTNSVKRSGLYSASRILSGVAGVGVQHFGNEDVVRSGLVRRIIQAYEKWDDSLASKNSSNKNLPAGNLLRKEKRKENAKQQKP